MATTTPPDENYSIVMKEKRLGMMRHLTGLHEHPDNTYYTKCSHKPIQNKRIPPGEFMLSYYYAFFGLQI